MIAAGTACPVCEHPLGPAVLAEFSGDEDPLRITLRRMPALRCPTGHTYFAHPKFPLWLMNHLTEEDEAALPAGQAKGFLVKHYHCGDCGQGLAPKADHRHAFTVELQYQSTGAFQAELSMPVFKCTGCGKEQLHSLEELRKLTPAALVHAFKEARIKPPA